MLSSSRNAMDNASKNAGEMIGALTMQYNRGRQAAITNELVDIITGASLLFSTILSGSVDVFLLKVQVRCRAAGKCMIQKFNRYLVSSLPMTSV